VATILSDFRNAATTPAATPPVHARVDRTPDAVVRFQAEKCVLEFIDEYNIKQHAGRSTGIHAAEIALFGVPFFKKVFGLSLVFFMR